MIRNFILSLELYNKNLKTVCNWQFIGNFFKKKKKKTDDHNNSRHFYYFSHRKEILFFCYRNIYNIPQLKLTWTVSSISIDHFVYAGGARRIFHLWPDPEFMYTSFVKNCYHVSSYLKKKFNVFENLNQVFIKRWIKILWVYILL